MNAEHRRKLIFEGVDRLRGLTSKLDSKTVAWQSTGQSESIDRLLEIESIVDRIGECLSELKELHLSDG